MTLPESHVRILELASKNASLDDVPIELRGALRDLETAGWVKIKAESMIEPRLLRLTQEGAVLWLQIVGSGSATFRKHEPNGKPVTGKSQEKTPEESLIAERGGDMTHCEIPLCPRCQSPPAAEDVDDVCPGCGAYRFHCGRMTGPVAAAPGEPRPPEIVRVHSPYWERIPPSQVVPPSTWLATGPTERTATLPNRQAMVPQPSPIEANLASACSELVDVIDALTTVVRDNTWSGEFYQTVGEEIIENLQQLDARFYAALCGSRLSFPDYEPPTTADGLGEARVPYHRYGAPAPGIVLVPDNGWYHAMRCLREGARQAARWCVQAGTEGGQPAVPKLDFVPETQTVALKGVPFKVNDPQAFAVYKAIADRCPHPLTRKAIQDLVPGCRGPKRIRQLLNKLPETLRESVRSGPRGYWLDLSPPPSRSEQRRGKKGAT